MQNTTTPDKNKNAVKIPMIPMRGIVIFPKMILHFDVAKDKSVSALRAAAAGSRKVFLVFQKDVLADDPNAVEEVHKVGVIAELRQMIKTPEGATRVLVEGLARAKIVNIDTGKSYFAASVVPMPNRKSDLTKAEEDAQCRILKETFRQYCKFVPKLPAELYETIINDDSLEKVSDSIIFNVFLKPEHKQKLLETATLKKRAQLLTRMIETENDIMRLEAGIHEQVREGLDKNQREYYLREQMRVISRQLGDDGDEAAEYLTKITEACFPKEVEEKLRKDALRLSKLPQGSQEANLLATYLESVFDIPWNAVTPDNLSIEHAQVQLDHDHYGLHKVKERVTEMIAVRALNPDIKGQIICLAGPPGVGKTSIGRSVAEALGRKFARISLGGVRDEAEIRGHRKTYLGAMPGRIVKALTYAKSVNPVLLLDEIDKMSNDYKGDPSAAMLEVLDPEQNVEFTDHYVEIPLDLSRVLFIATANNISEIPAPLRDRMDIIELGSYTSEEKFHIAKEFLLPKQLIKHGESGNPASSTNAVGGIAADTAPDDTAKPGKVKPRLTVSDAAMYNVIDNYTKEAGVRSLEKQISKICRKAAKILAAETATAATKVSVTPANLEKFLGKKKFRLDAINGLDEVGIVNGLAWTAAGGTLLPLEVIVMPGTGKIEITGSLGDVMKESSKIAVSLTRSLSEQYGIDPEFYKNKDLHIHAPEGAVPKDGPSAGVSMTTALVSALSGIAVRRDVAMTGEITLHGKVLPIGGLREKSMAAYRAGVKTIIVPKQNKADLSEIDDVIKDNLRFVFAENIGQVLKTALTIANIPPFVRDPAVISAVVPPKPHVSTATIAD